jgi:ATP-dependent DNA helicase RecG
VYPLIQESEKMDFKDLMDGYESIFHAFSAASVTHIHFALKRRTKKTHKDTTDKLSVTVGAYFF